MGMDSAHSSVGLKSIKLPFWRRSNPRVQNLLMSACLFCNPGLYLTLLTLGAGGGKPSSIKMVDVSNGALYAFCTVSAILGGTLINMLGPRIIAMIGVTGYPLYIGSLWYFEIHERLWAPVLAGCYLGVSGGCLWSVAGFFSSTYAEERQKGSFRAFQWASLATGAVLGCLVTLVINLRTSQQGTPHYVYLIFVIIQCCSIAFAALLSDPSTLIREDGTALADFKQDALKDALKGLGRLFKDWRILVMLPVFFSTEIFIILQTSINAYAYNLRTRSLNSILSNIVQIPFTLAVGWALDNEKLGSRRRRGLIVICCGAFWVTGTYIAQTIWLASWKFDRHVEGPGIDWTDSAYPGALVIYLAYGAQYGLFQDTVMWILGTLTNQPRPQAHMGGLCVGVHMAGMAVAFGIDAVKTPYLIENGIYFALATLSWPIMFFIVWKCTTDTNYFKEENVVVPLHVRLERELEKEKMSERFVGDVKGNERFVVSETEVGE